MANDKNGMWKGKNASYSAKHIWIKNKFGSSEKCEFCKKIGKKINNRWNLHWANISGKFKRERSDWLGLCVSCHKKYDLNNTIIISK